MSVGHPSEEALFEYAAGQLKDDERANVEDHIASCSVCRQMVVELCEIAAASRDLETWVLLGDLAAAASPDLARDVADRARRADREEREAAEVMAELHDLPITRWWLSLRHRTELHTAGMVRALLTESRSRVRTKPRESLQIVTIAADIARTLQDRFDAPTMVGLTANELGTVLRHLGAYPEALAAIDHAAAALNDLDSAPDEQARVEWNRATVLFALERYRDARTALEGPKQWFRAIRDEVELARIGILEGSILHDEGDCAGALAEFMRVAQLLETQPEQTDLAWVYANIAFCHLALGDFTAARAYGERATETYARFDMPDERIHTQWMLAQLLISNRNVEEGLRDLQAIAAAYQSAGMIGVAAQVDLERVEVLLRIDAWPEAAEIAARLATVYERTGQRVSHVHALAYLREAVTATAATPELARYVREYIGTPEAGAFLPPRCPLPS